MDPVALIPAFDVLLSALRDACVNHYRDRLVSLAVFGSVGRGTPRPDSDVLVAEQAWSDVIRESQEVVELALKGLLREIGVDPPTWHDVGGFLLTHRGRLSASLEEQVERLAAISAWLRKEGPRRRSGRLRGTGAPGESGGSRVGRGLKR